MYKKVKTLKRCDFASVTKCVDTRNNNTVIIKKYINSKYKGVSWQLIREASNLQLLNHPFIVKVLDITPIKEDIGIVLEYGGENLKNYRNRKPYSERVLMAKDIFYQIILACLYLHENNIMHRDIKPENILVKEIDSLCSVKLCDFGVSKFETHHNKHSNQVCTLSYRAPELFTENNVYTSAVDVWSIACVFYEFIIGVPIFSAKNELDTLKSILSKVPVNDSDLEIINISVVNSEICNTDTVYKLPVLHCEEIEEGKELENLLYAMLNINPHKRPTLREIEKSNYFNTVRNKYANILNTYTKLTDYNVSIINNKIINPIKRVICLQYIFSLEDITCKITVLIAAVLFDVYINRVYNSFIDNNTELIAICCVIIISKYFDITPLRISSFEYKRSIKDIVKWEKNILFTVNFEIGNINKYVNSIIKEIDIYDEIEWSKIKEFILKQ